MRTRRLSNQNSIIIIEFFIKKELYSIKALIIQEIDFIVLVIFKDFYIYSNTILFLTTLFYVFILIIIRTQGKKKVYIRTSYQIPNDLFKKKEEKR